MAKIYYGWIMDIYYIEKINETYIKVTSDPSLMMELSDYFTFDVPGAKFSPAYRNKVWDGKIRLLNLMTGLLYGGLIHYIESFCKQRNYNIKYLSDFSSSEFSVKEAKDFIKTIDLTLEPRDYQIDAFIHGIRDRRKLFLSPTASGKSLIIYLLTRYYNTKTLLIVPTTSLVSQMASDFLSYGYDDTDNIHRIYSGQEKFPIWIYITTENGIQYKFEGNETITLINNKKKLAKELLETDEIDDRWLSSIK